MNLSYNNKLKIQKTINRKYILIDKWNQFFKLETNALLIVLI